MKRIPSPVLGACLVSALAVACAQPADDLAFTAPGGHSAPIVAGDPAAVADRAVEDVTAFWRATYTEVYGEQFRDLAGFHPYGPDTPPPPCGEPPPRYEEIADNAFYCPFDDIIAWDEHLLIPKLNEEFGAFTVAIVIAHEFGHAIQDRAAAVDRTVDLELQADCFAGAWTRNAEDRGLLEPGDLDEALNAAAAVGDDRIQQQTTGRIDRESWTHGSSEQRVQWFRRGFDTGDPQQCDTFGEL